MDESNSEKSETTSNSAGAKKDLSIELPLLMEPQKILRMRILQADKQAVQYRKFVENHASLIKRVKSLHDENVQWQKDVEAKNIESNKLKEELQNKAVQMQKLEDLNKDLNTQLNDLKFNQESQSKEMDKQILSIENVRKENKNLDCKLQKSLSEKENILIENQKLTEENKQMSSKNENLEIQIKDLNVECEILRETSTPSNCSGFVKTKSVSTNTSQDVIQTKSIAINTIEYNIMEDLQMSSDDEDEELNKGNSINDKQMVSVMTNTPPLKCFNCIELENEIMYHKAMRQHTKMPPLLSPIPEEFEKSVSSKSVQVNILEELALKKMINTKIQEVQNNVGTMSNKITTEYNSRSAINTYTILSALRRNRDKLLMSVNACGYKYTNNFSKIDLDSPNALPEVMKMMYSFLHDVTESVQDAFEVITKQFNKTSISSYIPQIDIKSADDIILNGLNNNLKNGKIKKKRLLKEVLDADNTNDFDEISQPCKRSQKNTLLEDNKLISPREKITNIENENLSVSINEDIVLNSYGDSNNSSHIDYPQHIAIGTELQDTSFKAKESYDMVGKPPPVLEDPGSMSHDIMQNVNLDDSSLEDHQIIPVTDQESPNISQKNTSMVSEDTERMKRNLEIFAKGKKKVKKSNIKINPIPQFDIYIKSGIQNDVPESNDRNQSKKKSKRKRVELFGVEKLEFPKEKRKKLSEKKLEEFVKIEKVSPVVETAKINKQAPSECCNKSGLDLNNINKHHKNLPDIISDQKQTGETETLHLGSRTTNPLLNTIEVTQQRSSEFCDKSDSIGNVAKQKSKNLPEQFSEHKEMSDIETFDIGSETTNSVGNIIKVNQESLSRVSDKTEPNVINAITPLRMEIKDTAQHLSQDLTINVNDSQSEYIMETDVQKDQECETMQSTLDAEISKVSDITNANKVEDISLSHYLTISQMNNNDYCVKKSEITQNIVQKHITENNILNIATPVLDHEAEATSLVNIPLVKDNVASQINNTDHEAEATSLVNIPLVKDNVASQINNTDHEAEATSLVNIPLVKDNVVLQINNTESYYKQSEMTKTIMNYKTTESKIYYQNTETPIFVLSNLLRKYVVQNGWQSLSEQFPKIPQAPGKKIRTKMDVVVKILAEFLKNTDLVASLPMTIQKLQQLDLPNISLRFSQCLLYQMSNQWSEIFKNNPQPAAKLVALIHHLGQIYDGFLDYIMKAICYKLFRLKQDNDAFMLFYSQVYIALCIKYNKYSTLSIFLLDSLYCLHYKCLSIVQQLLIACPALLQIYEPVQTENILHSTVKHLLWSFKSNGDKLYTSEKMTSFRQMIFFKYKIPENSRNADDLLTKFLQKAKCAPDLEIYLSTILLARRESPIWVMNKLINQGYFSLLQMTWNEYVDSSLEENREKFQTSNLTLSTVKLCIQVLGAVCRTFDEANKDKVISIIFFMKDMLSCKDSPPEVQEAIVSGLIQLSRHHYNAAADAILLWSPTFLPSLNLINKIKRFIKREAKGFWNCKLNKEYDLVTIKNLST